MDVISLDFFPTMEPSLYEEDSYHFLQYYQTHKDWYVYDSNQLGLNVVKHIANTFCAFHGKVPFPQEVSDTNTYWSTYPLGVFKFKLLSDMSCGLAIPENKTPGYIVVGTYWDNGFVYCVFDLDENCIQIKLFIDQHTKLTRDYPEVSYL